jgi:hypothetical protein
MCNLATGWGNDLSILESASAVKSTPRLFVHADGRLILVMNCGLK